VTTLAAVLSVEAALVLAATVATVGQFVTHGAHVEADGIAFIIVLVIGFLWVGLAATGMWLRTRWSRGLTIVWQLMQLAAGVGALQGLLGTPPVGVVLLVLGLVGFVLVILPGVTQALRGDRA